MAYTVKRVAELAGVSVRTLHHYDHVGLLKPSAVSESGYRLYEAQDLERLQQIRFFRELDFPLAEIRAILDRPDFDRREALASHRRLLHEKAKRLQALIQCVDRTLEAMERGTPLAADTLFDGFDDAQIKAYTEEARARWGQTEAFQESARRTARYTQEDWAEIQREMTAIYEGLARLMDRDPADAAVQEWIGRWHQHLNRWFYTCSPEFLRNLGDLYVDDPRFTANIDKTRQGLAAFMRQAMHAFADARAGQA